MSLKSIFITGGTSGLGLEMARLYLAKGYTVGVCGRDSAKFSQFDEFERAFCYEADVVNRDRMVEVIGEYAREHGLNMVIASAGISMGDKSALPDFQRCKKVIDTNIHGLLNTFEGALEVFIPQKKGQLVGIASLAGLNGLPGTAPYSGSKAAVLKICESFAIDLKPHGIDVTCIAPGFVDTPLTQQNDHPMPFLLSVEEASVLMARAIEKKKVYYAYPFIFALLVRFLSMLPRVIYSKIMKINLMNYSTKE